MNYGGSIVDVCTGDSLSGINTIYAGYIDNYNYASYAFSNVPSSVWMSWGYKNIVTGAENLEIFESGNQICYRFNNVAHGTFGIQSYDNAGNMENHMYTR